MNVTELTQAIKLHLEKTFPFVHLEGEISNFKMQGSGHLYFSLKDQHAQISAVMFKKEAQILKKIPKSGDHVVVKGEINVYPPKGNYQLIIRELSFVGLGELLQKLEELKIKLHQKGWFRAQHKKPIPRFPKYIGVVTSPTGAVIQDIIHILTRRFTGFHLILNPVKVQGQGAALEIAQAINQFNQYQLVDVIIVGRGGGSLEDLWPFNEEAVAEAIYHSSIPIISAVGHETDHCIADYVADLRAPTPSAAAEIVVLERKQLLEDLKTIKKRVTQTVVHLLNKSRHRLKGMMLHPLYAHPKKMLEWRSQRLDDCEIDLKRCIQHLLQNKKERLNSKNKQANLLKLFHQISQFKKIVDHRSQSLDFFIKKKIEEKKNLLKKFPAKIYQAAQHQLKHLTSLFSSKRLNNHLLQLTSSRLNSCKDQLAAASALIQTSHPKNLLSKGYTILFTENKTSVINSIDSVQPGAKGKLLLSDGELTITIDHIQAQ